MIICYGFACPSVWTTYYYPVTYTNTVSCVAVPHLSLNSDQAVTYGQVGTIITLEGINFGLPAWDGRRIDWIAIGY